jgi:RNA-directed DNA polymerase
MPVQIRCDKAARAHSDDTSRSSRAAAYVPGTDTSQSAATSWISYRAPSRKKAIASIRDKVKAKTYRSTLHRDLDELILSLNRSLAGWANYFRHGASKATFSAVDYFVWGRLMRWIRAKYAGKTGLSMKELRRRFCDQGWRFAHNGVVLTGASSVAVTRYRYRGSTIPTPWTPEPAAADPGS